MRFSLRVLAPLFILFFICLLPLLFPAALRRYNIDRKVFLSANVLFFLMSLASFFMQLRGLQNKNPNVFIRSVTGGILVKMLVCIIAVILYVYSSGAGFSKSIILISLPLYLLYLFTEIALVLKMNKKQHA